MKDSVYSFSFHSHLVFFTFKLLSLKNIGSFIKTKKFSKSPCKVLSPSKFSLRSISSRRNKIARMFSNLVQEKRHYENPFIECTADRYHELIDTQTKKIHPAFVERLKSVVSRLLETLEQNTPSMKRDGSVYTGLAGVALLYFMMSEKYKNPIYLEKAANLIEISLTKLKYKDISFLCGDGGPLAIGTVIFHKQNNVEKSQRCLSQLVNFIPGIVTEDSGVPDELLYGRVGFLYALLFVNKYIPGSINPGYIKQVISAVIVSGRNLSKKVTVPSPLMYKWYDEFYLGGAHGIAGIMYMLLQVINAIFISGQKIALEKKTMATLMFQWHNKKYLGGAHGVSGIMYQLLQSKPYITPEQIYFMRPTVDFLLSVRYPSGNFPSSIGSETDRLVHWCHGAPGVVQMLCQAYEEYKDQSYLAAAEACGDVVWERGLLRKGYGLCHGVAGNAYTFLILYQQTKDLKHLYRACKFAEWCTTYNQYQDRSPDRPYSLFEGLAGTIYFLIDIQDPLEAKFPCFTV